MANIPSESAKSYIGIIVDNEDPNNLGGHKVFCPEIHGKNVNVDHLPWVRYQVPAGGGAGSINYGVLDKGQLVTFTKSRGEGGTGFGTITGVLQTQQKSNPNMPGNISLILAYPQIQAAINARMPINISPDIEETYENGARVRKIKEKGIEHSHSLLKEMMSHAAAYPLNGAILPPITNLSTAVQSTTMALSSGMQSLIPGIPFNISQILNSMPQQLKDQIFKSVPPEVIDALTNRTALMSSVTTIPVNGMMSSMPKINPLTFLPAAAQLLSGVKSAADLTSVLDNLMNNPTLGSIGIESIAISIPTPFGEMTQLIDPLTGGITNIIPDVMAQAQQAFGSMMTSLPAAGGSFFGDSGETISKMSERFKDPALQNKFKDAMEKGVSTINGADTRKRLNELGGAVNTAAKSAKSFLGG